MFLEARKYPATESLLLWWVRDMRIIMRDHKDNDNDKKIIKTVEDCEFFCFCFGHGGHSSSPTYCIHQIPNSRYTIPYQIRHLKSQITPSLIPNTSTTKIHSVLLQRRFFSLKISQEFLGLKMFWRNNDDKYEVWIKENSMNLILDDKTVANLYGRDDADSDDNGKISDNDDIIHPV